MSPPGRRSRPRPGPAQIVEITADADRLMVPRPGDRSTGLAAALAYAARGWAVFPCGVGSKQPVTRHGFKDATADADLIRYWSTRGPDCNVAVATGAPAVDVLDVDVRPSGSGWAALNRLRRAGLLTGTQALVETPSDGAHLYFVGTQQGCGSLPRHHLDLKARGGYVLVPPSVVNGKPYKLLDERDGHGTLDWSACRRLLAPPPALPVQRRSFPGGRDVGQLASWLAAQREGNRNAALYWSACRAIEAGLAEHIGALVAAAVEAGVPEGEARRTASSALRRLAS